MANKRKQNRGRVKNVPNMKKTADGRLVNQHGVIFTQEEKKALVSAANSANRKRARMLKEESQLPRKVAGKLTGDTQASLHLMGSESDFIIAHKSKSLQRFRSKGEYETYMNNLKRVNARDYVVKRVELYKQNYEKAARNAFGGEADDIIDHIHKMNTKDFMQTIQSDEELGIDVFYKPSDLSGTLNRLRAGWGLPPKEEQMPEY